MTGRCITHIHTTVHNVYIYERTVVHNVYIYERVHLISIILKYILLVKSTNNNYIVCIVLRSQSASTGLKYVYLIRLTCITIPCFTGMIQAMRQKWGLNVEMNIYSMTIDDAF